MDRAPSRAAGSPCSTPARSDPCSHATRASAVDLGAGDGRYVLAAAAARPDTLVIGVDASVDRDGRGVAPGGAARRAAERAVRRGGGRAPAVGAVRAAPTRSRVHFPWGSLLRGVLGHDDAALAGVARLLAPGAAGDGARVGDAARRRPAAAGGRTRSHAAYARHGLELVAARPATAAEIAASRSSWAKRLRAGAARPVTRLAFRRA